MLQEQMSHVWFVALEHVVGRRARYFALAMDVEAFVLEHLPPAPARVLEVGCGRGDLALAVARRGHDVVAIDPAAPTGDIFRVVALEDFADGGPFDAVVANRSLHHIADLEGALDRIACLLRPGGRVVVHEHAWERFDARTARWYVAQEHGAHGGRPHTVERALHEWREDHRDLHTATAMRAALDARFRQRAFASTPYLYGELGPAVTREQEQRLIEGGAIEPASFCYVGERPS
jgi:SAM-dependent methyltransferase